MNQLLRDESFRTHLITYIAVNVMLVIINIVTSPDKVWFFWPLLGWGIGIVGHAYRVHSAGKART